MEKIVRIEVFKMFKSRAVRYTERHIEKNNENQCKRN